MAPQSPNDPYRRSIARDVRFLSYRAGVPHPITRWIFLVMLVPILLIFLAGFFFEVAIQFHLMKPVPKPAPRTEEPSKALRSRSSAGYVQSQSDSFPLKPTGETK